MSTACFLNCIGEAKNKYDFRYLYFRLNDFDENKGYASMMYDTDIQPEYAFKNHHIHIFGNCGDSKFEYKTDEITMRKTGAGKLYFDIPNIKLWWPKHYGEPNLYDITVELIGQEGEILISKTVRRGFRTLELRRSEVVEKGGCFEFVVNKKRIMATGSNWVPMDAYHSRDNSRYKAALQMADDLGCNILRCWGGNVYEDHDFFNYCDEHGIMVWQDFAMACQMYPQNEGFMKKLPIWIAIRCFLKSLSPQVPIAILNSAIYRLCIQIRVCSLSGGSLKTAKNISIPTFTVRRSMIWSSTRVGLKRLKALPKKQSRLSNEGRDLTIYSTFYRGRSLGI